MGAPPEINDDTWARLMRVYKNNPRHIDPFTGGLAETTPADGSVGPLFACIIKKQFESLRDGDRFFFTHRRDPANSVRSLGQVAKEDVLKRGLASVLCDNVDKDILNMHQVGQLPFKTESFGEFEKIDCARTHEFNFDGIVTEAFEALGVGQGSVCNECEQGWEKNGANCYFWSTNKMNWTDAEDFCKEKGAHLASVTSSTINDYILEGKAIRDIPHLWVGGTDAEIEDVWKWTDGSAWEFTFWGPGEPNNFGPQCLVYHPSNTWDDRTCFWEDKFLCSQTRCQAGEKSGRIESPGHPSNYPNHRDKTYDLEVESGSAIELTFERFELEKPHSRRGCIWDWVEVIDGDGTILMRKSCGGSRSEISGGITEIGGIQSSTSRPLQKKVTSRTSMMVVEFHSDRGVTGPGFLATWRKVASKTAFRPPQNQVTSPNYPFNYPNNVFSDEIEIGSPDGRGLELTFQDFVLEQSEGCSFDFVQVLDKISGESSDKLCGSELPAPITSAGNMTIIFHSDSSDRFRGFRATWTPV